MKIENINLDININELKQKILKYDVISFDIFDTLLLRPYVKPTDLFLHLEKLENTIGFAENRIFAEQQARNLSNNEDITFEDIYNCIDYKYKFLKTKELELEQQTLQLNPEIYEVYEYAKQNGKKIIITSDMYLPKEFLLKVLKIKGYTNFDKLYLSSDIKLTKWTGNLYKYILNDLNIDASKMLHIGDNKDADITSAKKQNIGTCYYPKIIERYIEKNKHKPILDFVSNNIENSILVGVLAINSIKNNSINGNFWEKLGYEYGGISCYAYMKWLEDQVIKDGIKDIMFVARDGYSLQKVFDSFNTDIKTHYIYAPRGLSTIYTLNHHNELYRLNAIFEKYKDDIKDLNDGIFIFEDTQKAIDFFNKHKTLFEYLANKEIATYKKYLLQNDVYAENTCTVDTISWFFTGQQLIKKALNKNIKGYYWQTSIDSSMKYSAFFKEDSKQVAHFVDWNFMEFIMTSPEPPIKDIDFNGKPIYQDATDEEKERIKVYPLVSKGIIEFSKDINVIFGEYNILSNNLMVKNWINLLANNPSIEEINNFSEICHSCNNNKEYIKVFPQWYRKKLSVIIPCYNVEKFLSKTLDSVINQTYTNLEIICVNDGSTDNSGKILDSYAKTDKRIKIINKKNAGLAAARNTGLEYVSGDYVAFLDSDDWIDLDFYKNLIDRLELDNSDIAIGETHYIYPNYIEYNGLVNEYNFKSNKNVVSSIKDKQYNIYACACWNKVYKAELIKNNNLKFPDGLFIEDVPFTFATTILANKISLVRGAILNYRQHENSIMEMSKENRTGFDIFKIYNACERFLFTSNLPITKKREYKKILNNFEIFNIFGWAHNTCIKFEDEFYKEMKNKFKTINIKNNKYVTRRTRLIYKAIKEYDNLNDAIKYIENPPESILCKLFSIKNDYKHKVINLCGFKLKIKSKKLLKRIGSDEDSFMENIFSIKNIDTRKIITIFGIKIKIKSKKLIERKKWDELQNSINYVNHQLCEQTQKYEKVTRELNNKIEHQTQKYEEVIRDLDGKLEQQNERLTSLIKNEKNDILEKQYIANRKLFNANRINKEAFLEYKAKFRNRDVVLVGAGPTVNNFENIKDAIYVGCNRAFLKCDINFDFLFAIDKIGICDYYDDFFNYNPQICVKFIGNQNLGENFQIPEGLIPISANIKRYETNGGLDGYASWDFPYDISSSPLCNPPTVSLQAMQFILWTQPKRVYLVGIDCTCSKLQHFQGNTNDCTFRNEDLSNNDYWSIEFYKKLKIFAQSYYPNTEIISINPVGLKGIFKDVYTESYLAEHPEIREEFKENIEILKNNEVINA